jgi:hypothetical protein
MFMIESQKDYLLHGLAHLISHLISFDSYTGAKGASLSSDSTSYSDA